MSRREKLLHPATFISLIALFVAMGGVGYAATKIGTKQIKNRAVTAPKLRHGAVTTSKIRQGAVRNGDLANNSVSSSKIQPGSIVSGDLAAGSVLNSDLGTGAVTGSKIANDTIGTVKLQNGSVASDKIGTGAVIASKLGANSVTTAAVAPNAITAAQIAPGQVVKGNGALSSFAISLPDPATDVPVLSFPGLGVLQASCTAGETELAFANVSGTQIDVRYWGLTTPVAPGPVTIIAAEQPLNGQATTLPTEAIVGVNGMASLTTPAGLRLVSFSASAAPFPSGGLGCLVSAQATYTSP